MVAATTPPPEVLKASVMPSVPLRVSARAVTEIERLWACKAGLKAEVTHLREQLKISGLGIAQATAVRAEARAREASEQIAMMLRTDAFAGTFRWDLATDLVTGDERFAASHGYEPALLGLGVPMAQLQSRVHPDDGALVRAKAVQVLRGESLRFEYRLARQDAGWAWVELIANSERDHDGRVVQVTGILVNITDRKRAEAAQDILNRELSHRLKNTLTLVQSIAAQTLRNAPSMDAAREALAARLIALGKAHDILLAGHTDSACVVDLVQGSLALHEDAERRFRFSGPSLHIGPSAALSLTLILHELATNATKYGALSQPAGRVTVAWSFAGVGSEAEFRLVWSEQGGPPVTPPTRKGFGSRLIERGLSGGMVELRYPPEGMVCTLITPLAGVKACS
jgi:PAS domain S-box-containing protein